MDGYDGDAISDQEWDGADQERLDDMFSAVCPQSPKTVYVTKYALTAGIQERTLANVNGKHAEVHRLPGEIGLILFWKPDWHETRKAAVARAEVMRKKKLASLKKQIAKLEALSFND